MDRDQLAKLIEKLHGELGAVDALDDRTREDLRTLAGDIERLAKGTESDDAGHATAVSQLEDAALRFESEHPRLSMVLGELMDALGKLGI